MFPGVDIRPQAAPPRAPAITSANATLYLNVVTAPFVRVTLLASVTITMAPGLWDGQTVRLALVQDGTGSRTVTFDSTVSFGTDVTSYTATTTASKADFVGLMWNAVAGKWNFITVAHGF